MFRYKNLGMPVCHIEWVGMFCYKNWVFMCLILCISRYDVDVLLCFVIYNKNWAFMCVILSGVW